MSAPQEPATRITYVLIGFTSGIGRRALDSLIQDPSLKLIVGARHPDKFQAGLQRTHVAELRVFLLDLVSLSSVKQFASNVEAELGDHGIIDALLLNAAVCKSALERSEGSWTVEAVVNHFSQHYLVQLLTPTLRRTSSTLQDRKPRIIITSSTLQKTVKTLDSLRADLHYDDAIKLENEMSGKERGGLSRKRYAETKLVQMLAAHYWLRDSKLASVDIVAVSPGFIPTTGLYRESSFLGRFFLRWILYWAPFCSSEQQGANAILNAISQPLTSRQRSNGESEGQEPNSVMYIDNQGNTVQHSRLVVGVFESDELTLKLKEQWCPSIEVMESWS
ncbi:hypothetical protein T439DRAFT_328299 [Meredithblackwellia eburnea MCA 4105]